MCARTMFRFALGPVMLRRWSKPSVYIIATPWIALRNHVTQVDIDDWLIVKFVIQGGSE